MRVIGKVKLKNIYNNEVVYCDDYNNVRTEGGVNFIRVYHEEKPERTFLVNREAYNIVTNCQQPLS